MVKVLSLARRDAVIAAGKSIYSAKNNRVIEFKDDHSFAVLVAEEDIALKEKDGGLPNKAGYKTASYYSAWQLAEWVSSARRNKGLFCEVIDSNGVIYEVDLDSSNGIGLIETGASVVLDEFSELASYKQLKSLYNDILGLVSGYKNSKQTTKEDFNYMESLSAKARLAMIWFNHTNELACAEKNKIFGDSFFEPSESYERKTIARLKTIKNQLDYSVTLAELVVDDIVSNAEISNYRLALTRRELIRKKGQAYLDESNKHPNQIDHEQRNIVGLIISHQIDKAWGEYVEKYEDFDGFVSEDPYELITKEYNNFEADITRAQQALNKAISDNVVKQLLITQRYIQSRSSF